VTQARDSSIEAARSELAEEVLYYAEIGGRMRNNMSVNVDVLATRWRVPMGHWSLLRLDVIGERVAALAR
jgi:hypothetical protein